MLIYFTNNHLLGLDFASEFTYDGKEYHTLREFISYRGINKSSLQDVLLQRIQSNIQIATYFKNQYGDFCHITEDSMKRIRTSKEFTLTSSDFYLDNILGQVYTELSRKCNKPKKVKKQKEDRFEKMLCQPFTKMKKPNWQCRMNRLFFYAMYEQI